MRPDKLKTKIFLDGGNPEETREVINLLGFLDGQTTNPTLISKNPDAVARLAREEKFSRNEILAFYRQVVEKISSLIPEGSISVEVYADHSTTAREMFLQGKEMFSWIPNAHIKYPITEEGIEAAVNSIRENRRVNMTLCFSQEQAAAVYAATKGAQRGQVFISPFVGRLDDRGENGLDLTKNILKMYKNGDGHVEVLTASVRTINHLLCALRLGSDIITAPYKILKEWGERGLPMPGNDFVYDAEGLKEIPYREINLTQNLRVFFLANELTDKGIARFSEDWNKLIAPL